MEYFYLINLDKKQTEFDTPTKKSSFNNSIYSELFSMIGIIWSNELFKKIILIFLLLVFIIFKFDENLQIDLFNFQYLNNVIPNKFYLTKYFSNLNKQEEFYFNITSINFSIELKRNII